MIKRFALLFLLLGIVAAHADDQQLIRVIRNQQTDLKYDWYPEFMDAKFCVTVPSKVRYDVVSVLMHKGVPVPGTGDKTYPIGVGIILLLRGPYTSISDWPAYPPTIPARQARFYDANVTRVDRVGANIFGIGEHYYPATMSGWTIVQPGCWALESWAQAQTDTLPNQNDLVTMVQDAYWGTDLHRLMVEIDPLP